MVPRSANTKVQKPKVKARKQPVVWDEIDMRFEQVWREKFARDESACGWNEARLEMPKFVAVREEIARRTA